jgi:hypothetical protein
MRDDNGATSSLKIIFSQHSPTCLVWSGHQDLHGDGACARLILSLLLFSSSHEIQMLRYSRVAHFHLKVSLSLEHTASLPVRAYAVCVSSRVRRAIRNREKTGSRKDFLIILLHYVSCQCMMVSDLLFILCFT